MYFITKNKIADYIEQHPAAQTTFLTWLKEYPYREGSDRLKHLANYPPEQMLISGSSLSPGNYEVKYHINPWLNAGCIVWLGTREALIEERNKEFEKQKAQNPGLEQRVKTTTVIIQVPAPRGHAAKVTESKIADQSKANETPPVTVGIPVDLTDVHLGLAPEVFPSKINDHIVTELDLKTKPAYGNALNRAIAIFGAQPGTSEFDELALLLPLIRHYEASHIELPRLAILDVIKLKMEQINMPSSFFIKTIGSQEKVDLFLAGKSTLPEKKLQTICNKLFIRIPLNDQSLIK